MKAVASGDGSHVECPVCGAALAVDANGSGAQLVDAGVQEPSDDGTATGALETHEPDRYLRLLGDAQTSGDADQTASDSDQTASDEDQALSDQDEQAAQRDQDASDHDLAQGGDSSEHERSMHLREQTSSGRRDVSLARDEAADARAATASDRDGIANDLDELAAEAERSARWSERVSEDALLGWGAIRARAASDRAKAAADRLGAAIDRRRALEARESAAALRAAAALDRAGAASERQLAGIDDLTGADLRSIGLMSIEREIQRARRTRNPFAVVFVDVNDLKHVNDTQGHLAGDALLRRVANTLRSRLRPYDVIVRFGGDEFVCALPGLTAPAASQRFAGAILALEETGYTSPLSYGVAELEDEDDLERLIGRADAALIAKRRSSGHWSSCP